MSYAQMEHTFNLLTDEQQKAIFNLAVLLLNSNSETANKPKKRTFGQYAGRATAVFADDWEMTDEELTVTHFYHTTARFRNTAQTD